MTTIEIIAQKAGVSRGTVDRVLHNRGQVKPETAERVRAVLEEMNFQTNTLGRALYLSRKGHKIGVLVALREPDFQAQVLQGVEDGIAYAKQYGIETVVEFADPGNDSTYVAALERLVNSGIHGLALRGIASGKVNDCLQTLKSAEIPVVAYNQDVNPELRNCFVGQNSYQSGVCAAFLMQQIAKPDGSVLIVGVDPLHASSEERIRGFLDHLRKTDGEAETRTHLIYGKGSHDLTYQLTREKLQELSDLAGIFVSGAGLSGAAQAVDEAALAGTVKVVGFDTTKSNTAYLKKGTVQFLIDQGPYMQGYRSVQLLADAIFQGNQAEMSFYDTGIQIKSPYNC